MLPTTVTISWRAQGLISVQMSSRKDAIAYLKSKNPGTKVLVAVGGATYENFAALNTKAIADVVKDFGFDGVRY